MRVVCLLLMVLPNGFAQPTPATQKHYDAALQLFAEKNFIQAEKQMHRAIELDPSNEDALLVMAKWMNQAHRFNEAALYYRKALPFSGRNNKAVSQLLAENLIYAEMLEDAEIYISPNSNLDHNWRRLAAMLQLHFQTSHKKDTLLPRKLLYGRINTNDAEQYPQLSMDNHKLYFTRRVNNEDEEIYYSERDSCEGWLKAKNMGFPINTLQQDAAQDISFDGHYLFLMRSDNRSISGYDQGGYDLFMAYRGADSVWSVPLCFGATLNTPGYEGMPTISPDNHTLYFVSDRAGGYGGLDIWKSEYKNGLWQMPENLGPTINTSADETAPYLFSDNKTLFFASNGHLGYGGVDLFKSKKINDSTWSTPQNLESPINTAYDETSIRLAPDGQTAFYSSNKNNAKNDYDLYEIGVSKNWELPAITYIKGRVTDSVSKKNIALASLNITDNTGNTAYQITTNRGDGSYEIVLPLAHTYYCTLNALGYQPLFDTLRLSQATLFPAAVYNFSLLPEGYQPILKDSLILTLNFETNTVQIADSNKNLIQQVLENWKNNTQLKYTLNGYTDNTGNPLLNEQIGGERAQQVAKELLNFGIDKSKIEIHSFGESNPLVPNDSEENKKRNRRVTLFVTKPS